MATFTLQTSAGAVSIDGDFRLRDLRKQANKALRDLPEGSVSPLPFGFSLDLDDSDEWEFDEDDD